MDITHVASFDKVGFVHVSVDTYSGMLFASAHSGEKVKDVNSHCLQAFAYMGAQKLIKIDISNGFQLSCDSYDILHKTGIPYNPQEQAIVEWAH